MKNRVHGLAQLQDMPAMRKHGVFCRRQAHHGEIAGKTSEAGDFDAAQILEAFVICRSPANAVAHAAKLARDFADVRGRRFAIERESRSSLSVLIAGLRKTYAQGLSTFDARGFKMDGGR